MADEWVDDEGEYQEALERATGGNDMGEIRYALTPLGALVLDEGGAFSGFGPCAVSGAAADAAPAARPRRSERGRRRATPLFG